jgi:plasmid stabilization system protein ParE
MQFRFSRRAEVDLEEITAYIARDNPVRAVSFVRELREHCRRLVAFPEAARLRPELGEGVRSSGTRISATVRSQILGDHQAFSTRFKGVRCPRRILAANYRLCEHFKRFTIMADDATRRFF